MARKEAFRELAQALPDQPLIPVPAVWHQAVLKPSCLRRRSRRLEVTHSPEHRSSQQRRRRSASDPGHVDGSEEATGLPEHIYATTPLRRDRLAAGVPASGVQNGGRA